MESQSLTPNEIDQLPAGRELDSLIAEKIMGFKVRRLHTQSGFVMESFYSEGEKSTMTTPKYSTEIAAAWLVVEKLQTMNLRLGLSQGIVDDDQEWISTFTDWTTTNRSKATYAETAPLAICRAALKVVMGAKE